MKDRLYDAAALTIAAFFSLVFVFSEVGVSTGTIQVV